jgi:hypothetical protein
MSAISEGVRLELNPNSDDAIVDADPNTIKTAIRQSAMRVRRPGLPGADPPTRPAPAMRSPEALRTDLTAASRHESAATKPVRFAKTYAFERARSQTSANVTLVIRSGRHGADPVGLIRISS